MPWQHYFYDEHCPSFTIRHLVFLAPIRGLHLGTPYTGDCFRSTQTRGAGGLTNHGGGKGIVFGRSSDKISTKK